MTATTGSKISLRYLVNDWLKWPHGKQHMEAQARPSSVHQPPPPPPKSRNLGSIRNNSTVASATRTAACQRLKAKYSMRLLLPLNAPPSPQQLQASAPPGQPPPGAIHHKRPRQTKSGSYSADPDAVTAHGHVHTRTQRVTC